MRLAPVPCICALAALMVSLVGSPARAEQSSQSAHDDGWHVRTALALRAVPVGTSLGVDAGYRWQLFDSESLLLKDTYVEAGLTTDTSPSNFWGGAYLEAVPLALLKLELRAQSLSYYGAFGYLYVPDDPADPDWSLDAIDGDFSAGQAAMGVLLEAKATLRAKVGNVVAMAPLSYTWVRMDVEQAYYESSFDFLMAPTDQMWSIRPLLGYAFVMDEWDSWVLAGLRWEHTETLQTALSRDMPSALALWKLPGALAGGEMQLVTLGGYWLSHPNRQDTWYLAGEFSVDWRY